MIVTRRSPWIVVSCCALLCGCAHQMTPSLRQYDLNTGYRFERLREDAASPPRRNSDDIFVVLAFSGGGTRAAALSTGWTCARAGPCGVSISTNPHACS